MKNLKLFGILLLAWFLGACSKSPSTYVGARLETFTVDNEDVYTQANQILQADYMFAVDVSASMGFNSANLSDPYASKRAEFMAGMVNFVDELESQNVNYRIGFINGNVNAGHVSDLNGRAFYKNILIDSLMSSSTRDGLVDELQDIGQTLNENTNLQLEAANRVMSANGANFVRPGSQLIYLFVSDSDDESNNYISGSNHAPSDYASSLIAQKGAGSNVGAFVNARAIVAGENAGCDPAEDFGESAGTRLAQTAQIIENRNRSIAANGGAYTSATVADVSHCILRASTEFPALLSQLARDVSKPTNLFQVQVANVDVNSIQVYQDGTLLPNSAWVYLTATKAVRLNTTPPASSRIELHYNQFFDLQGTPASVSNIHVKANGSLVLSSSSDGWTYDSANNRIEFNGTALPNGTRIEVSY